jgi:hypothetical protein
MYPADATLGGAAVHFPSRASHENPENTPLKKSKIKPRWMSPMIGIGPKKVAR